MPNLADFLEETAERRHQTAWRGPNTKCQELYGIASGGAFRPADGEDWAAWCSRGRSEAEPHRKSKRKLLVAVAGVIEMARAEPEAWKAIVTEHPSLTGLTELSIRPPDFSAAEENPNARIMADAVNTWMIEPAGPFWFERAPAPIELGLIALLMGWQPPRTKHRQARREDGQPLGDSGLLNVAGEAARHQRNAKAATSTLLRAINLKAPGAPMREQQRQLLLVAMRKTRWFSWLLRLEHEQSSRQPSNPHELDPSFLDDLREVATSKGFTPLELVCLPIMVRCVNVLIYDASAAKALAPKRTEARQRRASSRK